MWDRVELKMRGKQAFRRNYWPAVLVALVMAIVSAMMAGSSSTGNSAETESAAYNTAGQQSMMAAVTLLLATAVFSIVAILFALLKIFIGNLLLVGGSKFFLDNQTGTPSTDTLLSCFHAERKGNVVLTMFLRDLFTGLWSLLLIVPGVIKFYEYRMIPYILAENPAMDRKEAFLISKNMMNGQKMAAFVLDLSFIGWRILEALTFGILGVFYVEPYYQATISEMYSFNRTNAYQQGYIR